MKVGVKINANLPQELFCVPGGDVSCYHDQPCSCNDALGWSDPCLTSLSSLTFYPGLPANHNPDLSGQSASKYDLLRLIWVQLWCVSQRVFSHLSSCFRASVSLQLNRTTKDFRRENFIASVPKRKISKLNWLKLLLITTWLTLR